MVSSADSGEAASVTCCLVWVSCDAGEQWEDYKMGEKGVSFIWIYDSFSSETQEWLEESESEEDDEEEEAKGAEGEEEEDESEEESEDEEGKRWFCLFTVSHLCLFRSHFTFSCDCD